MCGVFYEKSPLCEFQDFMQHEVPSFPRKLFATAFKEISDLYLLPASYRWVLP
ncbi:hypothetical protein ACLOJK_027486 [Asimina triloba]